MITAIALISTFASEAFGVVDSIGTFEKLCAYRMQQPMESSFFIVYGLFSNI
jgi:hypothetical protein